MGQGGLGGGWEETGNGSAPPINNPSAIYDATASGTNTYTTPAITGVTSLFTGLKVAVTFTNGNTTASTLQINGFAVVPILKANVALVAGDITTGTTYILDYDGTNFQMLNAINEPEYAVAGGTDTYTATVSPAIAGYGTGKSYILKFTNANTGASTLNLNGIGAVAIQRNGRALVAGDIAPASVLQVTHDGTVFQIVETTTDYFTINTSGQGFSPADATTYYSGLSPIAPTTTSTDQDFNIGIVCVLVGAIVFVSSNTTAGTAESVTAQLRNVTQGTSSSIGTFTTNLGSATVSSPFTFTGLNIAVASGDSISLQIDTPTWGTNPVSTLIRCILIFARR